MAGTMQSMARRRLGAPDPDRRKSRRYQIRADVEYCLIRRTRKVERGRGSVVNVSSGGVLFEAERALDVGFSIELTVAWPARLSDTVGLSLWIGGRTVRSDGNRTAVTIRQYEFHTRMINRSGTRA